MYICLRTHLIKINNLLCNRNHWFRSKGIHFADFSLLRIFIVYKSTQTQLDEITTIFRLYETGFFLKLHPVSLQYLRNVLFGRTYIQLKRNLP
jgi:hypothetical protein